MTLYLDNAATTFPKPASVHEAVKCGLAEVGASPGRGAYRLARKASSMVEDARTKVASVLGIHDPDRVIFTKNATESINIALKGWLRPGDRVVTSAMEHNAVVRPLWRLKEAGIEVVAVRPAGEGGVVDPATLKRYLEVPTRLVILNHASNVNGALQPAPAIAEACRAMGTVLLLDAAQTAGLQPIEADAWNLGMLACSGHKALLGPPGVGVLYIRPDLDVFPLMEGGTGTRSEDAGQPMDCPDRYESGTPNLPGIVGLAAGVDFILEKGRDSLLKHETEMAFFLEEELGKLPGVRLVSPETRGTGTVSFVIDDLNPGDAGYLLDEGFDIAVRTGLHCAPLAHRTLGTFPQGTIRVSPGYSTTPEDLEYFLKAVRVVARHGA